VTTYLVSEFARRDVTVILSGVGGDELFGGYRRYLGSHYRARLDRVPGPLRRAAIALADRLPADRHSPILDAMRLARGFLASADLPFDERYRSYMTVFPDDTAESLLRERRRANSTRWARPFTQPRRATRSTACSPSTLRRNCPTICCCSPTA